MAEEDIGQGENTSPSTEKLQEQFDAWRKESIVHPGQDVPLKSLEEQLQSASKVVGIRRISLLILLVISVLGLSSSFTDFAYFLSSSDPAQLGNVREAYVQDDPLEEMEHNRYVRMEAMIPTSVFDSAKHRFFFCPLYNVIVQTGQEIREKQTHKSYFEIAPGEERILKEKLAFVWDLALRLDIQGRLLSVDHLPSRYQNIWNSFRNEIDVRDDKPVYLLIDDEEPGDFIWFLLAYVLAFGVIAFSGYGYLQAVRYERSLRAKLIG